MDEAEFRVLLERFGKETIAKAEARGRGEALVAVAQIIRKAKMAETKKTFLLHQIADLALSR